MKPSILKSTAAKLIAAREPFLVVGSPGIGKTDIIEEATQEAGCDSLVSHPVTGDTTDAKGLPWKVDGQNTAMFLPFGDLATAMRATRPLVWFLDDLGQAPPLVQASYMQLILARRINDHKLPDCVTFAAATNKKSDKAAVSGILEPVKSRFEILTAEVDVDDWCIWGLAHDMPTELLAFARFRPGLWTEFKPTADIVNTPSPRTMARAGRMVKLGFPPEAEMEVLTGAIGEGAAVELMGFLKIFRSMPSLDTIMLNPDSIAVPEDPATLYAIAVGLARRATVDNIDRVIKFGRRMPPEYGVVLIKDAVRRDTALQATRGFVQWVMENKDLIL